MAQIVNGLDLALSFLWSCSPKSKAKTRPRHAAKARQLAMLLQRGKHVKQSVPRQSWCESLPAQCVIRPAVQKSMCFGEHAFRVPKSSAASVSSRNLTLTTASLVLLSSTTISVIISRFHSAGSRSNSMRRVVTLSPVGAGIGANPLARSPACYSASIR